MAANKLERLQEKKAKIREQLAEIAKQESAVLAEEKARRRAEDNRVKLLLGVAVISEVSRNPAALALVKMAVENLTAKDRAAVAASVLWQELTQTRPEAAKAPAASDGTTEAQNAASAGRVAAADTPLNVPFAEKEQAKALGARYNAEAKHWYAPAFTSLDGFEKWL